MSQYEKEESSDRYSLRGKVFHQLREDILSGHYKEHEELREMAISEEMGVSRTPVREALRHIVGVQLRNLATVGGSIYSRFGFSDVLTLFMAMDCSVELYKGGIVSLREYAERPYDRDILVRLIVKKEEAGFFYQSVRNSQTDIPVLTCAAARLENGSYRIAIGARPLKAVLFELPAKAGVSAQELAQNFADEVKQKIVTGSNMRGNAEYRRHLAGVLTKRAVLELEARTAQEEN